MRKLLPSVLATGLLAGCQTAPVTDPHSQRYVPPPGTLWVLQEDIVIPTRSAHLTIMNGRVSAPNLYRPHCRLWVRDLSDSRQTVRADVFTITETRRKIDCVVLTSADGIQLASAALHVVGGAGGGDGGASDCRYINAMTLRSEKQPQVMRLDCQQLDDPGYGRHVTFDQMQITLRPLAEFRTEDGNAYPPPIDRPEY